MAHLPSPRWGIRAFVAGVLAAALGVPELAAQTTSAITGRITDATSGGPVAAAQVALVGTNRGVQSNTEGNFALRALTPGNYTLRVLRIGYAEQTRQVTVTAGQTVTVNIALRAAAFNLAPVVATATGDQRRIEVGNSIATVDAAKLVEERPVANMSDLLVARTPGVNVLGSASTGGGQRIRIRGASSLSLSNEPIVFIDGIRATSSNNSASIGIGGTNPSRLSDFNPEEIESIEVIKGPSASTLYGTDAANGVIVIKTKRGRSGPARWNAYTERGFNEDRNRYPDAYHAWTSRDPSGRASSVTNTQIQCYLTALSAGRCSQDSVTKYNLFADPSASPLQTGVRQQYGLNVGGGTENINYFVSGEWEDETGQVGMPSVFAQRIREQRGINDLPRDQDEPMALRRTSIRANLGALPSPKMDIAVNTQFISSSQRLPQLDNNAGGLQSNAFGGPGFRQNTTTGGVPLYGYRLYTPNEIFAQNTTQNINRWIGSGTGNYRPTTWLSANMSGGLDFTSRNELNLCQRTQCTDLGINRTGFKTNNRTEFFAYTLNASATATERLPWSLEGRTTVGVQYVRDLFQRNGASVENLPVGATQLSAGSTNPQVAELQTESKTAGAFLQQTLAWRDVLFGTAAVRTDKNSSFGANFPAIYYPKFDVSYVLSKESYFPVVPGLENLRLRAAFGQSGRQPGTTDATRYYLGATYADVAADAPALSFHALGNPGLRPEVTQEFETGFDAAFLNNRFTVDATYYRKTTRDGLVERPLAPSLGTAASQFANLGQVRNVGYELLGTANLIDRRQFGFELAVNFARNDNTLLELGEGIPPIVGATRQQREGFPLNGLWQRPLTSFADANGDNIITLNEIVVGDTAVFIGREDPRTTVQFTPTVRLLSGRLRLSANVDRQTGFFRLNGTDRIRCESRNNCRGAIDRTAPLWEQARAVAVREHPSRTQAGFMERGDFTRLREISAAFDVPGRLLTPLRASGAALRFGVRNVRFWSDYSGIDPESNYFDTNGLGTISDFQTAPPPTLYTLRLDLRF